MSDRRRKPLEETIKNLEECLEDKRKIIVYVHVGYIIDAVEWLKEYNERLMTTDEAIKEIEEYIADADKAISEDEEYIRGWKSALLVALEVITNIT